MLNYCCTKKKSSLPNEERKQHFFWIFKSMCVCSWLLHQLLLTNFLSEHLQIRHALIFEQLDAVDTVKAIVFDHEERWVDAEPVQDGAFPLSECTFLPPAVLDPLTQKAVGVRGERVAQFSAATFPEWTSERKKITRLVWAHRKYLKQSLLTTMLSRNKSRNNHCAEH